MPVPGILGIPKWEPPLQGAAVTPEAGTKDVDREERFPGSIRIAIGNY